MSLVLIDATSNSITVSWPETQGASRYILEYRKAVDSDTVEFDTLSDKLTATQARKRNLKDEAGTGFFFRAGAPKDSDDTVTAWKTHSEPFHLLPADAEKRRASAPTAAHAGTNQAALVRWKAAPGGTAGYELQMRENRGGSAWSTIASSLSATEVRKKNLTSPVGYQFRVRPVSEESIFSSPSDPFVALGLSAGMKQLFCSLENGNLLRSVNEKPIPLADALGGKEFVLLYASAHWCGPCRQFTPQLTKWYQSQSDCEVVFLSADHDENGFRQYYGAMPWP